MKLFGALFRESKATTQQIDNVLDMVTRAAGLASNQDMISPLLDPVRSITARVGNDQPLSGEDQQTLLGVYVQLEDYLTTKEPLRTFNKENLRSKLSASLKEQLTQYEANHKGV